MHRSPQIMNKLFVDCGFARVAIRELSVTTYKVGKKVCRTKIDIIKRANRFQSVFPDFAASTYYAVKKGQHLSQFNKHCKSVIQSFNRKWSKQMDLKTYMTNFSISKWVAMTKQVQSKHRLSNCPECANTYHKLQVTFPGASSHRMTLVKTAEDLCRGYLESAKQKGSSEASVTQCLVAGLQNTYEAIQHKPFVEAIVNDCPGLGIEKRQTPAQKKKDKRKIVKECVEHLEKIQGNRDAQMVLEEGLSLRSYNRIHLSQSFESPKQKAERGISEHKKLHSPSQDSITWDTAAVMNELTNWNSEKKINWSELARKYGVPGRNGGQIIKEYAKCYGVDTYNLDGLQENRVRRAKLLKMPGNEISVPVSSTVEQVKQKWTSDIANGTYSIGETCAPKTLTVMRATGGKVIEKNEVIHSRKVPLTEIRERWVRIHEPYMRLQSDNEINLLTTDKCVEWLHSLHEQTSDNEVEMKNKLKTLQRNRHIMIWHDHDTLFGHGYIFITVKVLYDPAVFYTQEEVAARFPNIHNIQAIIEKPEIFMIGVSSCSHEDQAALLNDRISCLKTLDTPVTSAKGIAVFDTLRFFSGDVPARNFERGAQQGGNIRCGGCGVQSTMTSDLAHSLTLQWRSLQEQQDIILAGAYGKMPLLKPLCGLKIAELQKELRTRGIKTPDKMTKKELEADLQGILRGFVRVPTLLMTNPQQHLRELHLEKYCILECEPLHDIKGHIHNLLTEISSYLSPEVAKDCEAIINQTLKKEKKRGCDYRLTAILLVLHLIANDIETPVTHILRTIVEITDIMYSPEWKRSPKSILRLYNLTWLHGTACIALFHHPKYLTGEKMFGAYFHALTTHAAQQYEIVCLKSVNAENEERMFCHADRITATTSNRHPQHVIQNLLLRMQAKALNKRDTIEDQDNHISKSSKQLPKPTNTIISKEFVKRHSHSWQAHLTRISPYLKAGKDIWWADKGEFFEFFDGTDELQAHPQGPVMKHFRNTSIEELDAIKRKEFRELLLIDIPLPAVTIRMYDECGVCVQTLDKE